MNKKLAVATSNRIKYIHPVRSMNKDNMQAQSDQLHGPGLGYDPLVTRPGFKSNKQNIRP